MRVKRVIGLFMVVTSIATSAHAGTDPLLLTHDQ